MHHNTIFSFSVLIVAVLLGYLQVLSILPAIWEAESMSKSPGGRSSPSSEPSSYASAMGVSSPLGVSSKAKSILKSFSSTGPEVRPLPLPGRSNPNAFLLPPCTPNPEYIVVPQYIPSSGSMFANEPVVILFTNAFLDYTYSNDITRELMDLSMVPIEQYAEYIRRKAETSLIDFGVEGSASQVQFLNQTIMRNFGCSGCPRLSLPIMARKTANFMANVMYAENLLTLNNAESLGLAYAKAMADSASDTMTSDPTSKFLALCNGVISFLQDVGLFTKEKLQTVIFYYITEWYKAANDYKWW